MLKIVTILLYIFLFSFNTFLYGVTGWNENKMIVKGKVSSHHLICHKNKLYLIYIQNKVIYIKTSDNNGEKWSKPLKIGNKFFNPETPVMLFVKDKMYIFYIDHYNKKKEIFFIFSKDKSYNKFSIPGNLTTTGKDSISPSVTFHDNKIFLIWSEKGSYNYKLFYLTYNIKNNKWSLPGQVTSSSTGSLSPSVISWIEDVYLIWQQKKDQKTYDVMFNTYNIWDRDWKEAVNISSGINNAYSPSIYNNEKNIFVVYQAKNNLQFDIYLSKYSFNEADWNIPVRLTDDLNIEHYPVLVPTIRDFYLFWYEKNKNKTDIFYLKSKDGLIFNEKYNLSDSKNNSRDFKVIYNLENDRLFICWVEKNKGLYFTSDDKFCPAPEIIQSTHSSNQWTLLRDVSFKWTIDNDPSGIESFAYMVDHKADTVPDIFIAVYLYNEITFNNLKDGLWYFHICAKDGVDNISKTIHHKIMIKKLELAYKSQFKNELKEKKQVKQEKVKMESVQSNQKKEVKVSERKEMESVQSNQKKEATVLEKKKKEITLNKQKNKNTAQEVKGLKKLISKEVRNEQIKKEQIFDIEINKEHSKNKLVKIIKIKTDNLIIYLIKKGDTLWDISGEFYKKPWLYLKIAEYNNIKNPDLIYYDAKLLIPPVK